MISFILCMQCMLVSIFIMKPQYNCSIASYLISEIRYSWWSTKAVGILQLIRLSTSVKYSCTCIHSYQFLSHAASTLAHYLHVHACLVLTLPILLRSRTRQELVITPLEHTSLRGLSGLQHFLSINDKASTEQLHAVQR